MSHLINSSHSQHYHEHAYWSFSWIQHVDSTFSPCKHHKYIRGLQLITISQHSMEQLMYGLNANS